MTVLRQQAKEVKMITPLPPPKTNEQTNKKNQKKPKIYVFPSVRKILRNCLEQIITLFAFITEFTLKDSVKKAESYNSRGKVEFQEQRYENACQQYSCALECLPREQEDDNRVKYLCNRAACHVKLV